MTAPPDVPGAFASLTWVTMVADAETPPESLPLNGHSVGLRAADLTVMGSGPDNPGSIGDVRGYPRPGGPFGMEYLMTPVVPASIRAAFDVVPGPQGWQVPASRQTFANIGQQLINTYGVTPNLALQALTNLYNASRAELVYRHTNGIPINGGM